MMRSGVDGGEHSATLDPVMAGALFTDVVDVGADRGRDRAQIVRHIDGAYTAATRCTCHAPDTQHAMT